MAASAKPMDWVAEITGHANWVNSVCVSADGSQLFSGSSDFTIKVWDVATGACLQTLKGHTNAVNSVCVSADGSRLFSGSGDRTIKVWDLSEGETQYTCLQTLEGHDGHEDWVYSVCVSGSRLFSGSKDTTIKVWDASSGECLQTLQGHTGHVMSICALSDGRIVSGDDYGTIIMWRTLIHNSWVSSIKIATKLRF